MRAIAALVLFVLLCQAAVPALAEAPAPDAAPQPGQVDMATVPDTAALLTPENLERLERGESVSTKVGWKDGETAQGGGTVMVLIDAPKAEVWAHLLDYSDYAKYLPRVKKVESYLNEPKRLGLKITARIVVRTIVQHVINTSDEDRGIITWALDTTQKNDVKATKGAWVLLPHGDGKTIVVYSMSIDLGMRLPKWLMDFMITRDLPGFPEALKKHVEAERKNPA